ncbi:KilA-N domain-containing protein [Zooshikella ganghwensis]|uniref:KilA-N domain-containing protein n=1 Tax=Zooshikella ganghwensis TaxID=202772 RepID=A0A4P9VID8_9GAMM|nr:KilA-N domain-containing protein [Zooshikella ganghwensis]
MTIDNTTIRQDTHGRYCLNDLHKAAGELRKDRPNYWLSSASTRSLIAELASEADAGNPASPITQPFNTVRGGPNQGSYACKELVYAYAMWISPSFHLKVIRTFDAVATGQVSTALPDFTNPAIAARAWAEEFEGRQEAEQKVLESG